jgi:LmbE family N-acetylglucosaminyl deacetylase
MMKNALLSEIDYIPFALSELPEGPWLVLAPHADDESFGMGGSLLLAKEKKIDVYIVIMTDGSLGGDTQTRDEEAKAASIFLGAKELLFMRETDRSLHVNNNSVDKIALLLQSKKIKTLFFPHPMEPHPDHRATAVIGWEALRESGFSAFGYSYEISTQGVVNMAIDITKVVEDKKSLMNVYNSQLTQNNYTDVIIALNRSRTWSLGEEVLYAEVFHKYECEEKSLNEIFLDKMKLYTGKRALVVKEKGGLEWFKKLLYR